MDRLPTPVFLGFPGSSHGKESTCNAEDLGSIPGLRRSPEREHDNLLQYSCLENAHGQRNVAGYSPWNSPGQNIGVRSRSPLQGIFPNQGSNPGLLHCRWILYQQSHKGSPTFHISSLERGSFRNILAVQGLGLNAFTAVGLKPYSLQF